MPGSKPEHFRLSPTPWSVMGEAGGGALQCSDQVGLEAGDREAPVVHDDGDMADWNSSWWVVAISFSKLEEENNKGGGGDGDGGGGGDYTGLCFCFGLAHNVEKEPRYPLVASHALRPVRVFLLALG